MNVRAGSFVALLLGCATAAQAVQIPIAVTGFNQDFVVEPGGTIAANVSGTMDLGAGNHDQATWYGQGQNTGAPTTGLPNGVAVSEVDPNTTLLYQPFNANNVLLIDGGFTTGAFTLVTPAKYSTLAVFGSTGNGSNTIGYTVHFADLSTQSGSFMANDWFFASSVATTANGRISGGGYDSVNSGNPRVYQNNLAFSNPGSNLTGIDFTYSSGSGHTALFGVSGALAPVPEPSSMVLAGFGVIGLLIAARRRRV